MTEHAPDRWRRIESVYHEALECDASRRGAFLDEACRDDEPLRREVQSLLGYEDAAGRFLEHSALEDAARDLAADPSPALTRRRVGGYEISTLLGSGGMGEVYRARDVRLGREVALKVLGSSAAADPAYVRRFEEEARSASGLNHPNIVTIYGVGEDGDIAYIAMELVQGRTLREQLAAAMPMPAVLDIAVQLAAGLAAAHASGIVHRDLKPENVMVTPDGLVKVLDFGIARRHTPMGSAESASDRTDTRTALTEEGAIIGTVGYMSPEQAAGKPVGFASDQFAFGAILYEMLAGRRAFERHSKVATLAAIIDGEPEPVQHLNPRVPAPIRRVLDRCLAKDPAARYSLTRDLELELRRVRDSGEYLDTPDVGHEATPPGVSRRRILWLGGAAVVAAAAGLETWRLWPRVRTLAVLPFVNAAKDDDVDYLCAGLTESLIHRFSALPLKVMPASLVFNVRDAADPRAAGRQLGVQHVVHGSVTRALERVTIVVSLIEVSSGATLWTTTGDRASTDFLGLQDAIAAAIVDDGLRLRTTNDERRRLLRRPTNNAMAYDAFLRARAFQMRNSEEDYLRARELLEQAVARDEEFAEALVALAGTYWTSALDNFEKPIDTWPQVDRLLGRAQVLDDDLLDGHAGQAIRMFFWSWDPKSAEREWLKAFASADADIQPELLLTYALERWAMGHPEESLQLVRRARILDPLSPIFMLAEAEYRLHTGDAAGAADLHLKLIAGHPADSRPYFGLADARSTQQQFDDAIAARKRGHELENDDTRDDEFKAVLANARGERGYRRIEQEAVRLIELPTLERRAAQGRYASPLDFARAYAQLGHTEDTFSQLNAALADHAPALVFIRVDHAWDRVRQDARFEAVARTVFP